MPPIPVTLAGRLVRLEPLVSAHHDDLVRASGDPEVWRHISFGSLAEPGRMRAWIEAKAAEQAAGTWLPFAVIDLARGRAVGSTSYLDISARDRRLEIGGTWLGREVWRTGINTECKFLLLRHAFETLGCLRVQLKTDLLNVRSQTAITRLGAVREGVLRAHMRRGDGTQRDTVMFSIIAAEWPAAKARLEGFLAR
jgi:RimJ/RimL family protein N-acetyltransferase